ncbi:methyl-accepting chemotaxis protein [Serpentinimonas barnesii]|uniref:methyl-accepting chemotaxis protein n=1 Tax=Serpentinimonas barnesii TaxID=1458427 RepID=UPI000495C5AC|nr:methyl-accepting chemotaxis protein [Serpentinimonas barnesii]
MQNRSTRAHLSLRQKLIAAFLLLFVALLGTMAGTWWTFDRIDQQADRMAQRYAPQIERISDIQVLMFRISLEARHAMLVTDPADGAATVARIVAFREQKMKLFEEFEAHITTDRGREIAAQIRAADVEFWRLGQQAVGMVQAGDVPGAFRLLSTDLVPARDRMVGHIVELRQWQQQLMAEAIAEADRVAFLAKITLAALSTLVLLIAAWMVWSVLRMMEGAFARAQSVTRQIAGGELDTQVWVRPGDEFGKLFDSISSMQQRLNEVVSRVRQTSTDVVRAASELDHTNHDLSHVTGQQSEAIEATAEHARSMTGAIESSASNADNVSRLAGKASEIASQGGQAVTEVVQEMQRIDEASRRISEIVSVIDGIAFQTNILALNAAVEAARAGEQGRGFAVVAGEVRSLAQRSTQAAREVKQLIETSTQRVQTGSAAAENAGQTMQRVVESVDELSRLMGSIAQATAQQRASAQELDRAVGSLHDSSQQSADVVQRSQETAARLRQQANDLDETMGAFRAA